MPRKILVVDDSLIDRSILIKILGNEYDVIEAENGKEALSILVYKFQSIAAIIIDVIMPIMNGYELLEKIRANAIYAQLPIIVATAMGDEDSMEKALRLGATNYISKPYNPTLLLAMIKNYIRLKENAAITNLLRNDRLTGIYNRTTFMKEVTKLINSQPLGYYILSSFDIDGFKIINDQYGMEKGDKVLRHIGAVFDKYIDRIGGICCRISDDHFATVYPVKYQDSFELREIHEKVTHIEGLSKPLSFSIGRYVINQFDISPDLMYERASLAAQTVKGRYDHKIAFYDDSMREKILYEQDLVSEMVNALKAKQFKVWYQPQYNHASGALIGAEALVRWFHPTKGMIPPIAFIPLFEQNGFIYELDKFVWEEACSFIHDSFVNNHNPLPISVNVSRYDILCEDIVDVISGLVKKYDIPVDYLRLEITESAFSSSTQEIINVVKKFVDLGFIFEIDDFGSGYSSLNTLKDVPAQIIKLDSRLLENNENSQRGGNIVESIVRMAKWLGMVVIAEGVEKKEQADYLNFIGSPYVQGYLYAKPMPQEDYTELLKSGIKEHKHKKLVTINTLDNNLFWDPKSMETLIFNSYVGGACIFEYCNDQVELLRINQKYAEIMNPNASIQEVFAFDSIKHMDEYNYQLLINAIKKAIKTENEVIVETVETNMDNNKEQKHIRATMKVIAHTENRYLLYSTIIDTTALRIAEQNQLQMSEQLQAVMNGMSNGIAATIIKNGKYQVIFSNDRYYEMRGYTRLQYHQEVSSFIDRVHPEDKDKVIKATASMDEIKKTKQFEYRIIRRDNEIRWFRVTVTFTTFTGIEELVTLCTFTDITSEKETDKAIKDTAAELQTMMDDMPGGYARIKVSPNNDMKPVYFNVGIQKLTGMTAEELLVMYKDNALAGVHPDDIFVVNKFISSMIEDGEVVKAKYRLRHSQNDYVWLSVTGRKTRTTSTCSYLNFYYTEVTEQVKEEQLQIDVLNNLPGGAGIYEFKDNTLSIVYLNKSFWELIGQDMPDNHAMLGESPIHPEDMPIIAMKLMDAIENGQDLSCNIRLSYKKKEYRKVYFTGRIVPLIDRIKIYAMFSPAYQVDSSPIEKTTVIGNSVIREQFEKLHLIRDPRTYMLFRSNISKNTIFDTVEGTLLPITYPDSLKTFDQQVNHYCSKLVHPEDRAWYKERMLSKVIKQKYQNGLRKDCFDYREITSKDTSRWIRCTMNLTESPNNGDIEAFLLYENIDEMKKNELLIKAQAESEPLTGLLNRKAFIERFTEATKKKGNEFDALLIIDFDCFKQINDSYGHAVGDETLVEMSQKLKEIFRMNDLICRLGGDEFLIGMIGITNKNIVKEKAELVCNSIQKVFPNGLTLSTSVGISFFPEDGKDFDTLYRKADTALYYVKDNGKNNYALYDLTMKAKLI